MATSVWARTRRVWAAVAALGILGAGGVAQAAVTARAAAGSGQVGSGSGLASPQTVSFTSVAQTVGNRLVVAVSARGTTQPTISDFSARNGATFVTLGLDAGPFTNGTGGGTTTWVFSGEVTSGISAVDGYRVTYSGATPTRWQVIGSAYSGLTRVATAAELAGANTQNATTSVTFSSADLDTNRPNLLLFGVFAADGTNPSGRTYGGTNVTLAEVGTLNSLSQALSTHISHAEVTSASVSYNGSVSFGSARNTNSILVAYNAVPSIIEDMSGPATLDSGVCSSAFTYRLTSTNGEVPPFDSTTITVTSSGGGAKVKIGSCPGGGDDNSDTVVLNQSTSTFDVYVEETGGASGRTLTATGSNGADALASGVFIYDVTAAAATSYCLEFPGQTFVPGQCTGSGFCYFTDPPNDQVAGTSFDVRVIAVDATCQPATPTVNPINALWEGYTKVAGDGSAALEPSPITFDGSGEATITMNMVAAETVSPYFADDASLFGASTDSGDSQFSFNVTLPANSTTLTLSNPNSSTGSEQRVGYSARSNGEVEIRITNGTGGGITRIEIEDPGLMGDWSAGTSTVWNNNGTAQVVSGWTMSLVTSTTLRFQASSSSTFANGATLRFRARLNTGVYPNLSGATTYGQTVRYWGFQECVSASCLGSAPANQFTVRPPLPVVSMPTVARSSSLTNPRLNWTITDSVPASRAGVIVVRGTDAPSDTLAYAANDPVGAGSRVVCKVVGSGTTCDDNPGGGNNLADGATGTYRVYQYDSFNGYSPGVALTVPAKPTNGFVYRHTGTGLGAGGPTQDNEGGASSAPNASPGYVVFTSTSNNGLYFVKTDGTEQRRATVTQAPIAKRASAVRLQSGSYEIYAADNGTRAYRALPTGSSAPSQVTLGAAVAAGPSSINANTLTALNTAFNGDAILFATNAGSGNFVKGYRTGLTISPWTYTLADSSDGVSADTYIYINNATSTGNMMVPAGFGTGGIYGIDLANYTGSGDPKPAAWPTTRILSGNQFRAQCRKLISGTNVICGDVNGVLYAVNPVTGVQVGSTFDTGAQSILALVPSAGTSIIYVTRSPDGGTSAHVGLVSFNGSTFSSTWDVTVAGMPVLSGPLVIASQGALFVAGDASTTAGTGGSMARLDVSNGTVANTAAFDGDDMSDPVYLSATDTVVVQSDNGTIWARPRSSL